MLSIIVLWLMFFAETEIILDPTPVRLPYCALSDETNKLWFCQVQFVNKCVLPSHTMTTLSNIVILTSLPFPFPFPAKSMFVRKIIALKIERSLPTVHTLLDSICYHQTERKFEKMLLSNRKIKEANDDNKKTMAVKMVFDEWLLQSIYAVRCVQVSE